MAIEICPLGADWGNWADWAGVFVTGIAAIAVYRLTKAANSTAKASHDLAEAIATSAELSRQDEAMVVAASIYPEVVSAAEWYRHAVTTLSREGDWLERSAADGRIPELMTPKEHPKLDDGVRRFHLLPRDTAVLLTAAMAKQNLARDHAERYRVLPMSQEKIDAFRAEVRTHAEQLAKDFARAEDDLSAIFGVEPRH